MPVDRTLPTEPPADDQLVAIWHNLRQLTGLPNGAAFELGDGGRIQIVAEQGLSELRLADAQNEAARIEHDQLLRDAAQSGKPCAVDCNGALGESLPGGLLISRIDVDGRSLGVLELFLPGGIETEHRDQIEALFTAAIDAINPVEPAVEGKDDRWRQLADATVEMHRSLKLKEAAAIVVHRLARLLDAEAVSVLLKRGNKMELLDTSRSLEKANARGDLTRLQRKLATAVLAAGREVVWPTDETLAEEIGTPLADYVEQTQANQLIVAPIAPTAPLLPEGKDDPLKPPPPTPRPRGVLIMENPDRAWSELQPVWPPARDQAANAILNAERHERLPLRPLWTAAGAVTGWFRGRKLIKTSIILGILAGIIGTLFLVPATYHVVADGRLVPVKQRSVFAPWDARVIRVHVEGGQVVKPGEPLLELINEELEIERLRLQASIADNQATIKGRRPELAEARRRGLAADEARIAGEILKAETAIKGLQAQLAEVQRRESRRIVAAPMAGTITTFQPSRLLSGRAIRRGERLLEIMDGSGEWRLELSIEEHRVGHLRDGETKHDTDKLPIEFFLATDPDATHKAILTWRAARPEISADGSSVLPAYAAIEKQQLPSRRIGAEVKARIDCGTRSLGYVLFGDFGEFLQRRFWW